MMNTTVDLKNLQILDTIEFVDKKEKVFATLPVPDGTFLTSNEDALVIVSIDSYFIEKLTELCYFCNYDIESSKHCIACIGGNFAPIFNKYLFLRVNHKQARIQEFFKD